MPILVSSALIITKINAFIQTKYAKLTSLFICAVYCAVNCLALHEYTLFVSFQWAYGVISTQSAMLVWPL